MEPECLGASLGLLQIPQLSESVGIQLEQVSPHRDAAILLQQTLGKERTGVAATSVYRRPPQLHGPERADLHFEQRLWFPLRKAICVLYAGPPSATLHLLIYPLPVIQCH